jgi:hypothetical protein
LARVRLAGWQPRKAQTRENCGADKVDEFRYHPQGGLYGQARTAILRTEERNLLLEVGRDGKFVAKTVRWDETRSSSKATSSRSPWSNGRWVLTALPNGPARAPNPVQHYWPDEE